MPAGRPTKYDPAMCETVVECGRQGMGKLETCAELDIDYSTFEAYQEKYPEFSKAVKRGRELSQAWWEQKGREATFGGVDGFNATSYIFNMKNRFREDWKDKHDHEVNGNLGVTISRGDSDVL